MTGRETIRVDRKIVAAPEPARLWRYHKPAGLLTTNIDPDGRRTIFDELPKSLPRVVTIGRLDLNTEGLLLLTNDGELARALELPKNAFSRKYRARAYGYIDQEKLDTLMRGITVEGTRYGAIKATLEQKTGTNSWIHVELNEGKKREVRFALEALDLKVNRLSFAQITDHSRSMACGQAPSAKLSLTHCSKNSARSSRLPGIQTRQSVKLP